MPLTIRADSLEYVHATVSADHDLTAATLAVACPAQNVAPLPGDWQTINPADISVAETPPASGTWVASYKVLVGPGGTFALTAGKYDWTVRVTDTPEVPVRKVSTITVTDT